MKRLRIGQSRKFSHHSPRPAIRVYQIPSQTFLKGGIEMNGRSFKSLRLLLPLGSLVFCVSLMAIPTLSQDNQQTAPDNTKTNKDQAGPTADQQKMNPSDQALTQKIRKASHGDQSLSSDEIGRASCRER